MRILFCLNKQHETPRETSEVHLYNIKPTSENTE
jgi:hypothetical protein